MNSIIIQLLVHQRQKLNFLIRRDRRISRRPAIFTPHSPCACTYRLVESRHLIHTRVVYPLTSQYALSVRPPAKHGRWIEPEISTILQDASRKWISLVLLSCFLCP